MTFYYFGSVLLRETILCEYSTTYLLVSRIFDGTNIKTAINKDIKKFNEFRFGSRPNKDFDEWKADGKFVEVDKGYFVYRHSRYAIFSSISTSQFLDVMGIKPTVVRDTEQCDQDHPHDILKAYFQCKDSLLAPPQAH